jgi:hypothetical protein
MQNNPLKPKAYNSARHDFWYSLSLEERQALDELEIAIATHDPITQARALGRLKRTMMDYFAEKYLVYEGNYNGRPCYAIDYSYHTEWQKGADFSILQEVREQERLRESMPPLPLGLGNY